MMERPGRTDAIDAWMKALLMPPDVTADIAEKLETAGVTQLQNLFSLRSEAELAQVLPGVASGPIITL